VGVIEDDEMGDDHAPQALRERDRETPEPGHRALIVEDDAETREYMAELLSLSGLDVDQAPDAQGAREMVERNPPDVMLIDLMMPRENGESLLRSLRRRHVTIPALFVTALPGSGPEHSARELDAGLVRKPFLANDLLEAIQEAIACPPWAA
jgi:DNA-binding response OmpR family regulator